MGKNKNSIYSFHWHRHHKQSRQNKYLDPDYFDNNIFKLDARGAEVLGLFLLNLVHLPISWFFPVFGITTFVYTVAYYWLHMKGHRNPEWAKKWTPWHFSHHMGLDQNKNVGVVTPLWDYIFGTRVKYKYDENFKVIR